MKCFTAPYRFSMEARQPERRGHHQAAAPEFGAKLLRQHPRALKVQQAYQRRYYGLPRERARPTFVTKRSEERRVGKGVDLGGRRITKKKKSKRMTRETEH